jgi:hypothetical protein
MGKTVSFVLALAAAAWAYQPADLATCNTDSCRIQVMQAAARCREFAEFEADMRGSGESFRIEHRRCGSEPTVVRDEYPRDYLLVYPPGASQPAWVFDNAEESISYLESAVLVRYAGADAQQLLIKIRYYGTGNILEWCVLGEVDGRLQCWEVPDLVSATYRLIKPGEVIKGWQIAAVRQEEGTLDLLTTVALREDPSCCPSPGAELHVVLRAEPPAGRFTLATVERRKKP